MATSKKDSANNVDSLGATAKKAQKKQTKFDATESTTQSQRKSVNRQCGDSAQKAPKQRIPLSNNSNS